MAVLEDVPRVTEGAVKGTYKANVIHWLSESIYIDGEPMELMQRRYMHALYEQDFTRVILFTGRQVGKSLFLATKHITKLCLTPFFKSIYVAPRLSQSRDWCNDKLKSILENSPPLADFIPKNKRETTWQIFNKEFTNRSKFFGRSAYLTPDAVRGITGDFLCYDARAMALTAVGWKYAKDVTIDDLVATRARDGSVEYHRPRITFRYKNNGEMIRFKHRGSDLRVTPNHGMHVNYKVKASSKYHAPDKWERAEASSLLSTKRMGFKMGCGAKWSDCSPEYREFPEWTAEQAHANGQGSCGVRTNTYPGLKIKYKLLARIVGIYIAEGSLQWQYSTNGKRNPRPVVVINKNRLTEVLSIIREAGLTCSYSEKEGNESYAVVINSTILGRFLIDLGGSYDKYIPREFMDSPSLLVEVLKGAYYDASYHDGEKWENGTLRTRSRRLSEDVQEAWVKVGRPAVIHKRMSSTCCQLYQVPGKVYEDAPLYEVCAYNRDYQIYWRADFSKKERVVLETGDSEEVYCLEVPNHVILVKGTPDSIPVWCGQSLDEIQDMLVDCIPVLMECLSYKKAGSGKKYFYFSGTPKTSSHAIHHYWELSDKREWLVRCVGMGHCGKWNLLGYDNIGDTHLVCVNCGKKIDPKNGQWVATNPGASWVGFRIPQIMTPWTPIYDPSGESEDIKTKQRTYPIAKFFNEVLAMTYDEGAKPITEAELYGCCDPSFNIIAKPNEETGSRVCFAGVDWGSALGEFPSFTIVALGAWWHPGQLSIFYIKKFEGLESDIMRQPDIIKHIFQWYGVRLACCDWGYGAYQNRILKETFGSQRIMELQYVSAKDKLKYNEEAQRMMGDRTQIMQDMFRDIQQKKIRFFKEEQFREFGKDFTNIYSDYNEARQIVKYDHAPSQPDDAFHAVSYCSVAAKYHEGILTR